MLAHGIPPDFRDGVYLIIAVNRPLTSSEFIRSHNGVSMAFTASGTFCIINVHYIPEVGLGKRETQKKRIHGET